MTLKYQHRVLQHPRRPTYEPGAIDPPAVGLGFKDTLFVFREEVDFDIVVTQPHPLDRDDR